MKRFVLAAALAMVAGCSSDDSDDMNLSGLDTQINDMGSEVSENSMSDEADNASVGGETAQPKSEGGLPPKLRGRWGLVAADCTSSHGDAKGLMEVSGTTLTFYESRAELEKVKEFEPTRIRAVFSFEGEGMSWQRDMLLDVQDGGKVLIRKEYGEEALPEPLRYQRCES